MAKKLKLPKAQFGAQLAKQLIKQTPKWGAFNKSISKNKILMQEYRFIEETTKANGTWMKNSDGTLFGGTPEQFVQMRSGNFQKSFPNVLKEDDKIMPLIHHSNKIFDFFDESFSNNTKYGKGVYTRPEAFHNKRVGKSIAEIMDDSNDKKIFQMYGDKRYDLYSNDIPELRKLEFRNERGLNPGGNINYEDISMVISPYSNPLKSMIGNDGMFDLTNPNIYKQTGGELPKAQFGKNLFNFNKTNFIKPNWLPPSPLPTPNATTIPFQKRLAFNQTGQVIPQQHMVNLNRGPDGLSKAINDIMNGEPMWFAPAGDTRYLDQSLSFLKNPNGTRIGNTYFHPQDQSMQNFVPGSGWPTVQYMRNEIGNTGKLGFNEYPLTEFEAQGKQNKGYNYKYVKDKDGNVIDMVPDYDNPIMRIEDITKPGFQSKIEGVFSPDIKFKIFDDINLSRQGHVMHHGWSPSEFQNILDEGYDAIQLTKDGVQLENILLNPDKFKMTTIDEMPVTYDIPPFQVGGTLPKAQFGASIVGNLIKQSKNAKLLQPRITIPKDFTPKKAWSDNNFNNTLKLDVPTRQRDLLTELVVHEKADLTGSNINEMYPYGLFHGSPHIFDAPAIGDISKLLESQKKYSDKVNIPAFYATADPEYAAIYQTWLPKDGNKITNDPTKTIDLSKLHTNREKTIQNVMNFGTNTQLYNFRLSDDAKVKTISGSDISSLSLKDRKKYLKDGYDALLGRGGIGGNSEVIILNEKKIEGFNRMNPSEYNFQNYALAPKQNIRSIDNYAIDQGNIVGSIPNDIYENATTEQFKQYFKNNNLPSPSTVDYGKLSVGTPRFTGVNEIDNLFNPEVINKYLKEKNVTDKTAYGKYYYQGGGGIGKGIKFTPKVRKKVALDGKYLPIKKFDNVLSKNFTKGEQYYLQNTLTQNPSLITEGRIDLDKLEWVANENLMNFKFTDHSDLTTSPGGYGAVNSKWRNLDDGEEFGMYNYHNLLPSKITLNNNQYSLGAGSLTIDPSIIPQISAISAPGLVGSRGFLDSHHDGIGQFQDGTLGWYRGFVDKNHPNQFNLTELQNDLNKDPLSEILSNSKSFQLKNQEKTGGMNDMAAKLGPGLPSYNNYLESLKTKSFKRKVNSEKRAADLTKTLNDKHHELEMLQAEYVNIDGNYGLDTKAGALTFASEGALVNKISELQHEIKLINDNMAREDLLPSRSLWSRIIEMPDLLQSSRLYTDPSFQMNNQFLSHIQDRGFNQLVLPNKSSLGIIEKWPSNFESVQTMNYQPILDKYGLQLPNNPQLQNTGLNYNLDNYGGSIFDLQRKDFPAMKEYGGQTKSYALDTKSDGTYKTGGTVYKLNKAQKGTEVDDYETEYDQFETYLQEEETSWDYVKNTNSAVLKPDGKTYYKMYEDGLFYPYYLKNSDGTFEDKATIGFGKRGDDVYKTYKSGMSLEVAEDFRTEDIDNALRKTKIFVDSNYGENAYDDLPASTKFMLADYTYNLGKLSKYPKFADAIMTGNTDVALQEYIRNDEEGGSPLSRNDAYLEQYLQPWVNNTIEIKQKKLEDQNRKIQENLRMQEQFVTPADNTMVGQNSFGGWKAGGETYLKHMKHGGEHGKQGGNINDVFDFTTNEFKNGWTKETIGDWVSSKGNSFNNVISWYQNTQKSPLSNDLDISDRSTWEGKGFGQINEDQMKIYTKDWNDKNLEPFPDFDVAWMEANPGKKYEDYSAARNAYRNQPVPEGTFDGWNPTDFGTAFGLAHDAALPGFFYNNQPYTTEESDDNIFDWRSNDQINDIQNLINEGVDMDMLINNPDLTDASGDDYYNYMIELYKDDKDKSRLLRDIKKNYPEKYTSMFSPSANAKLYNQLRSHQGKDNNTNSNNDNSNLNNNSHLVDRYLMSNEFNKGPKSAKEFAANYNEKELKDFKANYLEQYFTKADGSIDEEQMDLFLQYNPTNGQIKDGETLNINTNPLFENINMALNNQINVNNVGQRNMNYNTAEGSWGVGGNYDRSIYNFGAGEMSEELKDRRMALLNNQGARLNALEPNMWGNIGNFLGIDNMQNAPVINERSNQPTSWYEANISRPWNNVGQWANAPQGAPPLSGFIYNTLDWAGDIARPAIINSLPDGDYKNDAFGDARYYGTGKRFMENPTLAGGTGVVLDAASVLAPYAGGIRGGLINTARNSRFMTQGLNLNRGMKGNYNMLKGNYKDLNLMNNVKRFDNANPGIIQNSLNNSGGKYNFTSPHTNRTYNFNSSNFTNPATNAPLISGKSPWTLNQKINTGLIPGYIGYGAANSLLPQNNITFNPTQIKLKK